jgi:hypothetical protein
MLNSKCNNAKRKHGRRFGKHGWRCSSQGQWRLVLWPL